ncbi:MAG: NADP-dependent isocitrate dehydrogenase, partial [Venatoribacter sp.]
MSEQKPTIIYTETDEAPILATYSLLPIVKAFAQSAGINVETRDISLAGRIIAAFPEYLSPTQQHIDDLAYLGKLTLDANANIIKLPNISASVPQMKACIKELQEKGFALPRYTADEPKTDEEFRNRPRYDKVKGSAVNPVLREGNSDRRAPASVKQYARKNPHSMGAWSKDSKSHVAHMTSGDFYGSEKSVTVPAATNVKIVHVAQNGVQTVLKEEVKLKAGEIIDGSLMSVKALREFYAQEYADAKAKDILVSVHLKATMMKVSDPILFGHAVSVYFADVFSKYEEDLQSISFNPKNGLADLYARLDRLPIAKANEIKKEILDTYNHQAKIGMVNSYKGITNLHFPNDVIVDASMPAVIRESGKFWDKEGKLQDTKAIIPDRCYAGIYQETIQFCKEHGAFDPRTMGSVPNVGLMAQQAEEYGSHDKTFEIAVKGKVQVVDSNNQVLIEHEVERGDIWRMCQTKDAPVQDWVKLAVNRARLTNTPAIFWLTTERA